MEPWNLIVMLLAICLGFATGLCSRFYLSELAEIASSQTETLAFDANVVVFLL